MGQSTALTQVTVTSRIRTNAPVSNSFVQSTKDQINDVLTDKAPLEKFYNKDKVDNAAPLPGATKNKQTVINVVDDYDWTYSQGKKRTDEPVPYVSLIERRLVSNSVIFSFLYASQVVPDFINAVKSSDISQFVGDKLSDVADLTRYVARDVIGSAPIGAGQNVGTAGYTLADFARTAAADVANSDTFRNAKVYVSGIAEKLYNNFQAAFEKVKKYGVLQGNPNYGQYLSPYDFLYLSEPTNTTYKFPYLDNNFIEITNEFRESTSNTNELGELAGRVIDFVEGAARFVTLTEPGVYIERPKFYNFTVDAAPITVTFPLLNTLKSSSINANYKLLRDLVVQNRPTRKNRLLIDPPVIYELRIPGRVYFPYVYMQNMSVEFVGNRRMYDVTIDNGNTQKCIVPDAYKVKLTFVPLTKDTNNFILAETGQGGLVIESKSAGSFTKLFSTVKDEIVNAFTSERPETAEEMERRTERETLEALDKQPIQPQ